jgi:DUF2950 family protein
MTDEGRLGRAVVALLLLTTAGCAGTRQQTFETPEAAMRTIADLAGTGDTKRAEAIFGEDAANFLRSGDPQADRADALQVKQMILDKLAFEDRNAQKIALVGKDAWPFPIPLVKDRDRWRFDSAAGREELLNRRIGRNELEALASAHAYVDAQCEYFSEGRDGRPPAYAQKFASTAGKHDGLYWPAATGEPQSPLGPLFLEAEAAGYARSTTEPRPFHGYWFRILTSQGKSAPGGPRSYVDERGAMTGGFALVAWPATYGNSGVMTFVVNAQGIVFQKDLGPKTDALARQIAAYDPDESWNPTGD